MYQKVNIRQLRAAGFRPRFTIHDSRFTIHGPRLPAFPFPRSATGYRLLAPGCPLSPAFLTTNHYPLITAFTPPPMPPAPTPLSFYPTPLLLPLRSLFSGPFPLVPDPCFYHPPHQFRPHPPCSFVKL
jgi:hypothetical protein